MRAAPGAGLILALVLAVLFVAVQADSVSTDYAFYRPPIIRGAGMLLANGTATEEPEALKRQMPGSVDLSLNAPTPDNQVSRDCSPLPSRVWLLHAL
jgi:hypothetical protein